MTAANARIEMLRTFSGDGLRGLLVDDLLLVAALASSCVTECPKVGGDGFVVSIVISLLRAMAQVSIPNPNEF
jgi:hypothetical protein